MDRYSDIIDHPRHISPTHKPMPPESRAVQFAPFAALTGFDDEIDETARLTDCCEALAEDDLAELDAAFQKLLETESEHPEVVITYFQPDARKSGGAYITYTGQLRCFDAAEKKLKFTDRTEIAAEQITAIFVR